jgi:hypothetical protein
MGVLMPAEYDPLKAAAVAHAQLPVELRQHLSLEDVLYMLYQEFQYHEGLYNVSTLSASNEDSPVESIVSIS